MAKNKRLNVYFLINEGVHLLDLAGPVQAFHEASKMGADIVINYVGFEEKFLSHQGLYLNNISQPPKEVESQSIVIVAASYYHERTYTDISSQKSIKWLKDLEEKNILLIGICTGSILLAKAKILDGKKCTCHHSMKNIMKQQFPSLQFVSDCIFVEDRNVITTAGVTAGLDLALEIIDRYFGFDLSIKVARDLVIHRRRLANDPQISVHLKYRNHISPLIHEIQDYIQKNHLQEISQNEMAETVNVTIRHLQRVFKKYTGITIHQYICIFRVEHAEKLMSNGYSLDYAAHSSGFPNSSSLRKYLKQYGGNKLHEM